MHISPNFVSQVFKVTASRMRGIGFLKRKPGIFTLPLNEDVLGWVGLNTANYAGGVLAVSPTVGVRHQKLETLVSNLLGTKPHAYIPPTICTSIGYVMPRKQFVAWSFGVGTDTEALVSEMVEAVDKAGKSFMERNANLLAIYETMRSSGMGFPHQLDYSIPVACVLLGKNAEAGEFLDAKLRSITGKGDPASVLFREFAARLREMPGRRDA